MGFRGYWFNNSGTYRTNKYPHCYVGIVKPSGAIWGGFGKYDGTVRPVFGGFGKYDGTVRPVFGGFGKYDGTVRPVFGGFGKYDGTVRPIWGSFGGDIMTHTVRPDGFDTTANFRIEKEWHKLEGTLNGNERPLYDATGHYMENPNYVIDLYYKLIAPGEEKSSLPLFFKYNCTDLTTLAEEVGGSTVFGDSRDGNITYKGLILGKSPRHYAMKLPTFSNISNIPTGTEIGNLPEGRSFWTSYFWSVGGNWSENYPFLNTRRTTVDTQGGALLSGATQKPVDGDSGYFVDYTINPSFATCGLPVTRDDRNYLMPELRTGFVMIDNLYMVRGNTFVCALYMCLDIHKI